MTEIKAALAPEQWRTFFPNGPREWPHGQPGFYAVGGHATAAINLYGQPFGFTQKDVEMVRRAARFVDEYHEEDAIAVNRVADRIAALLPPVVP